MKSNAQPDINTELFLEYIRTLFFPALAELRALDAFAEEITVLLVENGSSHVNSDVVAILSETRVPGMTLAPRITQIFQILGVTLFRVLKWDPRSELPFGDEKTIIKFIVKVFRDFQHSDVR
jgi:hypothetical protein